MEKIVAGVDGSEQSKEALRFAIEEGALRSVPVLAVHAWTVPLPPGDPALVAAPIDYPGIVAEVQQAAERLAERVVEEVAGAEPAARVEAAAIEGPAAEVLIDAAGDDGLIVVGSRGHGVLAELLLGSVSERVARHARCPVLIHRTGSQ